MLILLVGSLWIDFFSYSMIVNKYVTVKVSTDCGRTGKDCNGSMDRDISFLYKGLPVDEVASSSLYNNQKQFSYRSPGSVLIYIDTRGYPNITEFISQRPALLCKQMIV